MRRRCSDRYLMKIAISCLLIATGIVIILSYIPVWIWLCIIGLIMIGLGCFILKIWR